VTYPPTDGVKPTGDGAWNVLAADWTVEGVLALAYMAVDDKKLIGADGAVSLMVDGVNSLLERPQMKARYTPMVARDTYSSC
jgi:hypothetical protein